MIGSADCGSTSTGQMWISCPDGEGWIITSDLHMSGLPPGLLAPFLRHPDDPLTYAVQVAEGFADVGIKHFEPGIILLQAPT